VELAVKTLAHDALMAGAPGVARQMLDDWTRAKQAELV